MTRARKLRNLVTIQNEQEVRDDTGSVVKTWVDLATVWADIEEGSGKELIENQQRVAINTTKITIRYRDDIDETMRVVFRGREYRIIAPPVNKGVMNRDMILYCDGRIKI